MAVDVRVPVGVDGRIFVAQFIQSLGIPRPIKGIFTAIDAIFWFGRKIRNLTFMAENPGITVAGLFLDEQLGGSQLLRGMAQVVIIARVLNEFTINAENFSLAFKRVLEVFHPGVLGCKYVLGAKTGMDWALDEGTASKILTLPWPIPIVAEKVAQLASRIQALPVCAFRTFASLSELRETLCFSAIDRPVKQLPMELSRLMQNQEALVAMVRRHEALINGFFATTGLPFWTVDRVVTCLEGVTATADVLGEVVNAPWTILSLIKPYLKQSGLI